MDCLHGVVVSFRLFAAHDQDVDLVLVVEIGVGGLLTRIHGFDLLDCMGDLRVHRVHGEFLLAREKVKTSSRPGPAR